MELNEIHKAVRRHRELGNKIPNDMEVSIIDPNGIERPVISARISVRSMDSRPKLVIQLGK